MTPRSLLPLCAFALASALTAGAQAPAGAPAGSTGLCKDGTYSNAPSKSGACSGHKGVKEWYLAGTASPKPAAAAATKPATTATPAAMPAPSPASTSAAAMPAPAPAAKPARSVPAPSATAAPGGGPGMVWVNTSTKVYHCPGDRYYGKTKQGQYMTEAAAQAAGAHADDKKSCSK